MGNDYVNAMFESLQSNKNIIYCSELYGFVITKVSLLICCYIVTLLVGVVWPLITKRCPIKESCAKSRVHIRIGFTELTGLRVQLLKVFCKQI